MCVGYPFTFYNKFKDAHIFSQRNARRIYHLISYATFNTLLLNRYYSCSLFSSIRDWKKKTSSSSRTTHVTT